jgi:hypothetical protein|tara:strand:- start:15236 stop:16849 length:1614 start_codon:yes stop_codon:yes gene_type:complete
MYFKRPSFRKGGGINQLTPRVRAQDGFFGNTPIYPIPLNQIKASAAMPMGSGNVPMMRSFPQDATEMGVASIRSVEDLPTESSAVGKGTKFKKKEPLKFNTTDKFLIVEQDTITGGTRKVRIKNPNYIPTGEFRDIKGGKGKIFIEDKEEIENSGASAVGKGTKFKKSEGIIDIESGPAGDQITMATDKEKEARAAALLKSLEDKKKEVIPGGDDSSITLDPLEEIKKEKDFLSDLLKNEGLERGEIALIAAKALGTEGSLKEKLDAAVNLALPVVRRRDKEDKALTLSAYKAFKEKEKATAKATADAAKPTTEMKNLDNYAKILKNKGDKRSIEEIKGEIIEDKFANTDSQTRIKILSSTSVAGEISERFDDLRDAKSAVDAYIKKKGDKLKEDDKKLALLRKTLEQAKVNYNLFAKYPEFADVYPTFVTAFANLGLKEGGRVKRSLGSPQTGEQIITTEAETIGAETAEKPVLKLTFAELRNRLPQEITDDVVQLLANSEEALQDFAYIETQNDVDSFNLKYGVNLIIPPAPQTA